MAKLIPELKKAAILTSIFVYLCAVTWAGELLKIPVLLSHFIEHQSDNGSITFVNFLYQHYHADDGNDQDNARDEQLPFKSQDFVSSVFSPGIPLSRTNIRFIEFYQEKDPLTLHYREPRNTSPYLSRIWQPPKSA